MERKDVKEKKISDNLTLITSKSYNEERIYLQVNYNNGKFTIERVFPNNITGYEDFKKQYDIFKSEEKVKEYLGL